MGDQEVTLISGEQVPLVTVQTTLLALHELLAGGYYLAVYEFYRLCQDPKRSMFGITGFKAQDVGLLLSLNVVSKQARVHSHTRAVTLAAVTDLGGGRIRVAEKAEQIIRS